MNTEHLWNETCREKLNHLEKNVPVYYSVFHKSHKHQYPSVDITKWYSFLMYIWMLG